MNSMKRFCHLLFMIWALLIPFLLFSQTDREFYDDAVNAVRTNYYLFETGYRSSLSTKIGLDLLESADYPRYSTRLDFDYCLWAFRWDDYPIPWDMVWDIRTYGSWGTPQNDKGDTKKREKYQRSVSDWDTSICSPILLLDMSFKMFEPRHGYISLNDQYNPETDKYSQEMDDRIMHAFEMYVGAVDKY